MKRIQRKAPDGTRVHTTTRHLEPRPRGDKDNPYRTRDKPRRPDYARERDDEA